MVDFSVLNIQYNSGTDASPTWTGNSIAFGGTGNGANELRWAPSTGATASTASASWPYVTRPNSNTALVPQLWAFTADTTGAQINTYDGSSVTNLLTHYMVLRMNWDAIGTFASNPVLTMYGDNTLPTPVQNSQSGSTGACIVNGSTDTSGTSYMKCNAFGYGVDTSGTQQTPDGSHTPGSTTLTVTSGTSNNANTATGAWLTNWQSLQGNLQWIQNGVVPATHAGNWYFMLALFVGVTMNTSTSMLPVFVFQYTYA